MLFSYTNSNLIGEEIVLDATEFGKSIRELMARNNLCQSELAEKLEVPPSTLSNYITGKNIPEMKFLAKCIKEFGHKQKGTERGIDIVDFFYRAFLSTAANNHKIIFDTRFIDSARIEMLAKILAVLVLYPQDYNDIDPGPIHLLGNRINKFFEKMEEKVEFQPPSD